MMLKYLEFLRISNNLKYPHKGIVKSNTDSKKLGRLKVKIPNLLDGSIEDLPWVYPMLPSSLGGSLNISNFAIPEVNSEILVKFPYDSIYAPFYSSRMLNKNTKEPLFDTNYPNRYGSRDSNGTYWYFDKVTKDFKFHHVSGSEITISASGDIQVTGTSHIGLTAPRIDWNQGS